MNKPLEYECEARYDKPYWLEAYGEIQKGQYLGIYDEEIDDDGECEILLGFDTGKYVYELLEWEYNISWRLWPEKPTEEDLKENPWYD